MKCIINWFKNVSNILEQNCDIVKIQNNIIELYDLFTKKCCFVFKPLNKHY